MEGDTLPELTRSHTHFRTFTDTLTRTEALEEEQMGLRLIVKPPKGWGCCREMWRRRQSEALAVRS